MALKEEQDEQNQQTWLSRLEQGRQDLSASVGEALDDPILQELFWSDDEGEPSRFYPTPPDKGVFPPRLSLQSRVVMALRSDDGSEPARVSGSPREGYPGTAAQQQNTNALMRFAQRLTSSFSALGSTGSHSGITGPLSPHLAHQSFVPFGGQKASSLAAIADIEVSTASTTGELLRPEMLRTLQSSLSSPIREEPSVCSRSAPRTGHTGETVRVRPLETGGHKKRLAGHNTRVRLEVVPGASGQSTTPPRPRTRPAKSGDDVPAATMNPPFDPVWDSNGQENIKMYTTTKLSTQERERRERKAATAVGMRAMLRGEEESQRAVKNMDAVTLYQGMIEPTARGALSGSSYFEEGQSEAIVARPYITTKSVVLVTLTSNPGPVVVQYISLQPLVGFTVHMTAPVTARTSFNYVILLSELF